jgi:hypothetical protein
MTARRREERWTMLSFYANMCRLIWAVLLPFLPWGHDNC